MRLTVDFMRLALAAFGWLAFAGWCLTGAIGCNYAAALAFVGVFLAPDKR